MENIIRREITEEDRNIARKLIDKGHEFVEQALLHLKTNYGVEDVTYSLLMDGANRCYSLAATVYGFKNLKDMSKWHAIHGKI